MKFKINSNFLNFTKLVEVLELPCNWFLSLNALAISHIWHSSMILDRLDYLISIFSVETFINVLGIDLDKRVVGVGSIGTRYNLILNKCFCKMLSLIALYLSSKKLGHRIIQHFFHCRMLFSYFFLFFEVISKHFRWGVKFMISVLPLKWMYEKDKKL